MKTSWYQEPWAWLVVILPILAVVASIGTYFIANDKADTLVNGDYYKKGKAINRDITKVKLAQKLGIKFQLKLENNQLIVKPTGIDKKFPLLKLNFFHPTLAENDFMVKLTQDANGLFRYQFPKSISGKWHLNITPFTDDWKIQQTVYLPTGNYIDIVPDITNSN